MDQKIEQVLSDGQEFWTPIEIVSRLNEAGFAIIPMEAIPKHPNGRTMFLGDGTPLDKYGYRPATKFCADCGQINGDPHHFGCSAVVTRSP